MNNLFMNYVLHLSVFRAFACSLTLLTPLIFITGGGSMLGSWAKLAERKNRYNVRTVVSWARNIKAGLYKHTGT
jgi:hypothetical protein